MAELPVCSAQAALRYRGSDGPVKVMHLRSRANSKKFMKDPRNFGVKIQQPSLGDHKLIVGEKVEPMIPSTNIMPGPRRDQSWTSRFHIKRQGCCLLEPSSQGIYSTGWSALEDLVPKLNNIPRAVPFDLKSSYGPEFSYIGSRFIMPSTEEDLLWCCFIDYVTNAKDIEATQIVKQWKGGRDTRGSEKQKTKKEDEKKQEKKEENGEEQKEEQEVDIEKDEEKKREDDDKRREEVLRRRREKRDASPPHVRPGYLGAFTFGVTTEFNPSGMWIAEDFFYNDET